MRVFNHLALATAALAVSAMPASAQTFSAVQSTVKYTKISTTKAQGMGNYARATSSVQFDPVTNTYTLRDTGNLSLTSAFGPSNSPVVAGAFTNYTKNSGAETLRLYRAGQATQGVTLTHTGFGQWRRTAPATMITGTNVNDTYFVYGTKTAPAQIAGGTGNYTTAADGTFVNKDGVYAVTGTGTFSANFGTRTVSYSSTLNGSREGDAAPLAFGTLTGNGTIATASSSFKGNGVTNGSGYKMDVNGYFFGPNAIEVGGVFRLNGNGGNGQGALFGRQ
jgi:hypothetical protein